VADRGTKLGGIRQRHGGEAASRDCGQCAIVDTLGFREKIGQGTGRAGRMWARSCWKNVSRSPDLPWVAGAPSP
jgi:hypothetical protein